MTRDILYSDFLKEELHYKKLDSGLDVYLLPKKGYSKTHAYFATKYGSNNNEFMISDKVYNMPKGIAHFLEHKIFESSEKDIFEEFSKNSASVNAYTNFVSTCYLFNCTENYKENLELLMNFVQTPFITDENVEKEKGIIEQEIKMYEDNPDWVLYFNTLKALYNNHPVRFDIAGTVESIKKITTEELMTCYRTFYNPNNMFAFIVGDIDINETIDIIRNSLTTEFKNSNKTVSKITPFEAQMVKFKEISDDFQIPSSRFFLGVKDKDTSLKGKELLRKSVTTKILLELILGKSSVLYNKLYDNGLINNTFSYDYMYDIGYAHTLIGGESKNPREAFNMILDEVEILKDEFDYEDEFELIKKRSIGRYLSSYNSLDYIGHEFVSLITKNINPFDYIDILNSLSFKDVKTRLVGMFDRDYVTLSMLNPKKYEK